MKVELGKEVCSVRAESYKNVAVYSRKSKFTGKGESIENQIELCRQYIRLNVGMDAAEKALVNGWMFWGYGGETFG